MVVRKRGGEDRLEIRIAEVLSDVSHDMGEAAMLEKEGVERELQELLAEPPRWCGEGLRLVRREYPTEIGPVDLLCLDGDDEYVAVEIKRVGDIEAVEQLTRYLERIRRRRVSAGVPASSPPTRSSRRRTSWPTKTESCRSGCRARRRGPMGLASVRPLERSVFAVDEE